MIDVVAETGSTNTDLMARLGMLAGPTLLLAETQTAGRGRAGRTWYSRPGAALTFSLAWKFARPLQDLVGLPLATGVALAEALAEFGVAVELKWPNDLLKNGRKLAGILIETASTRSIAPDGSVQDGVWTVVGIGLNLALPAELPAEDAYMAADAPELAMLERNQLMAVLLSCLAETFVQFEQDGFGVFNARWNALHAHSGCSVAILDHGQIAFEGIAVGVDLDGRLLLDTATGRVAVLAGDVSLRAKGN